MEPKTELAKWIIAVTQELGKQSPGFMADIRFDEVIEQANGIGEKMKKLVGWQPINTAPKDGTPILARHNRGTWKASKDLEKITYIVAWWSDDCFNQMGPDSFKESELTHWMPLPEPPKGEFYQE